ncbi:hypothetical protein [Psychromicrobium sp. YIM B11713]|uniref:hypothetical protein n=1 Tax=Psychromicrobium sp. YIM B11713 TaxID=3145233 RepID=UPI00374E7EF6
MKKRIHLMVIPLVLGSIALGSAAPAQADAVNCNSIDSSTEELTSYVPGTSGWQFNGPSTTTYTSYKYDLYNATPTFNVSDTRVAKNDTDAPISTTFTSSLSKTYTISVTASMSVSVLKFLNASVSATITNSRTTQIGVSITSPVPAHSSIRGDYGVEAYDVTARGTELKRVVTSGYWVNGFYHQPYTVCYTNGVKDLAFNAPTNIEGWRVYPG